MIIQKRYPLILYLPPSPTLIELVKAAPKTVVITGDVNQAGALQGKILVNAWTTNKKVIDKNKDNVLQYVLLQGPSKYVTTISRTKYFLRVLDEAGIKAQQLLSTNCNWDKECARITIESAFLTLGDKMEAIIANNDEMALGAINALQKYGYNQSNTSKFIPVVGIGGSIEAKELIDKGIMVGTVIEDLPSQATAIYTVGMNLVLGKSSVHGTNLKFDESGITIKIPYYEYTNTKNGND